MQEKYKDKGVVLLALTDESSERVTRLVTSTPTRINYLIGLEAGAARGGFQVHGYPTIFVIDPENKVVYRGSSPMEAESYVKKLLETNPPKVKKSVATRYGEDRLAKADTLLAKKQDVEALHEFQKIVEDFGGDDVSKAADKKIAVLRTNPMLDSLIKEAEAKARHEAQCNKLLHLARALANAGHAEQAVRYYDQVTRNCDDTDFAKLAVSERASLNIGVSPQAKTP